MGKFSKFADDNETTPIPVSTKIETKSRKVENSLKSVKLKKSNYDLLTVLKTAGEGKYLDLLDEAITNLVEEKAKSNPQVMKLLAINEEIQEDPNQISLI